MGIIDNIINREQDEKTYTKSDVMAKLSMLEAPFREDCECESCSVLGCKMFNAGARAMATALLEGMDADEVLSEKVNKIAEIELKSLLEMAKRAVKNEIGGI